MSESKLPEDVRRLNRFFWNMRQLRNRVIKGDDKPKYLVRGKPPKLSPLGRVLTRPF